MHFQDSDLEEKNRNGTAIANRNREGEVGFKAKGISWIKTKRTAAPQGKRTGELVLKPGKVQVV